MQEFSRLQSAVGTGEIIRVRYHGGSVPGTVRDVQPLAVDSDYLKALCLASSAFKTFRLDKVELVDDRVPLSYDAGASVQRRFATIGDLAPVILPLISRPDVHVAVSPTSIAVHRLRKKDKKPFAYADHELSLTDNDRKPWVVFGKSGRAYGSLDRAAEAFLKTLKVTPPWPVSERSAKVRRRDSGVVRDGNRLAVGLGLEDLVDDDVVEEFEAYERERSKPRGLFARIKGWLTG